MQPEFVKEIIDIIIAAIIYLAAFALLMRTLIARAIRVKEGGEDGPALPDAAGGQKVEESEEQDA